MRKPAVKAHHKEYSRWITPALSDARLWVDSTTDLNGNPDMARALHTMMGTLAPRWRHAFTRTDYEQNVWEATATEPGYAREVSQGTIAVAHLATRMTLQRHRDRAAPGEPWWSWEKYVLAPAADSYLALAQRNRDPEMPVGELLSNLRSRWAHALFEMTGRRAYEVAPALAERLILTDLADRSGEPVLTDHLRLPYSPIIYIEVPPNTGFEIPAYSVQRKQEEQYPVTGIYLVDEQIDVLDEHGYKGRSWNVLLWGASNSADTADDALFFFNVFLPEGKSLYEALDLTDKYIRDQTTVSNADWFNSKGTGVFARNYWRKIFEWAMNVVLYATWPHADVLDIERNDRRDALLAEMKRYGKGSSQRTKLSEKLRDLESDRVIVLGGRLAPMRRSSGGVEGSGRSLEFRQVVQGHWKMQAYGKGRVERRLTFIEPYERGPEGAPPSPSKHRLT